MNHLFFILQAINNDDPINNSSGYLGPQSWVYYLIGAVFLVLAIISGILCYLYRNTKREYENIAESFNWFKKFWFLNRFTFMFMITLILFICSMIFFLMNSVFLKSEVNDNESNTINLIKFLIVNI